ncbi:MAG: NAD(P)H-dependent oxidoreductase [Defluviitaleaceae bacterium]|nr:NAD(P)H-dependent oxidoreductase [Defluviitaleaceae bacterium]
MKRLLFVNACMRGAKVSRTYRLSRSYLIKFALRHPEYRVEEVDLTKEVPMYMDADALKLRDQFIDMVIAGEVNSEMFYHASQFAQADLIVIGAPYWDLSFPTALKSYIENVAVRTITFKNTAEGTLGLCRAEKMVYITTAGGYIENADFGTDYCRGLCKFFGIQNFEAIRAEGLDIQTNDPNAILREAEAAIQI